MRVYHVFNIIQSCMIRHLEPPPLSLIQWCGETARRRDDDTASYIILFKFCSTTQIVAFSSVSVSDWRTSRNDPCPIPKGKNLKATDKSAQIIFGKTRHNNFMATKDLVQINIDILHNDNFVCVRIFPCFFGSLIHKSLARLYCMIWAWLETPIHFRNHLYIVSYPKVSDTYRSISETICVSFNYGLNSLDDWLSHNRSTPSPSWLIPNSTCNCCKWNV